MGQRIVAEMVAERALGKLLVRIDGPDDAEVGIGGDGQCQSIVTDESHAPAAERAGERKFRQPLGQGHDGGERQGRGTADEDVYAKPHAASQGGRMVYADAAMNLVVQADFTIRLILVAGKLHAVHAEIGMPPAGLVHVFGVDLRQGDEWSAIVWPADELR